MSKNIIILPAPVSGHEAIYVTRVKIMPETKKIFNARNIVIEFTA